MDLWAAIYNAGTRDEAVLGIYSNEESALKAAELASPGEATTEQYVLDETPDWVAGFAAEQLQIQEMRRAGLEPAPPD